METMKKGDIKSFDKNWKIRKEAFYTHWTKGEPQNQIQLAFKNHWTLFNELMKNPLFNKGKRVLEVGCGRGSLSCYFSDAGFDCKLLDSSEKAINIAEQIFKTNNLKAEFVFGDAYNLPFKDKSFDLVFSIGLLEHFEEIEKPIQEQIRILDSGGLFLGYVVPKYYENVQNDFVWINQVLKGYLKNENVIEKEKVFRSDDNSNKYVSTLNKLGLTEIQVSGVYPLPMISHSIDFPFSLMPKESEREIVKHFNKILLDRKIETGKHPWLCNEGFGQAFLVWGFK